MNEQPQRGPAPPAAVPEDGGAGLKRIAVMNHKGGVGKTTTSINLGAALAAVGRRTLIVDMDPQGNTGSGLGIDRASQPMGTTELLQGKAPADDIAVETRMPGLFVIPSSFELAADDIGGGGGPENRLRRALAEGCSFDYVIFDCAPSFGILSLNALVAAERVLTPVQAESYALEGLGQILTTVRRVRALHNPGLRQMIVLTMLNDRDRITELVAGEVRAHFGRRVLDTTVPREERVSEAAFRGQPVLLLDRGCPGSRAYTRLAGEVIWREYRDPAADPRATAEAGTGADLEMAKALRRFQQLAESKLAAILGEQAAAAQAGGGQQPVPRPQPQGGELPGAWDALTVDASNEAIIGQPLANQRPGVSIGVMLLVFAVAALALTGLASVAVMAPELLPFGLGKIMTLPQEP